MRAHVGEGGGGRRERASKQAMICNEYKLGACKGEGRGGEGRRQQHIMNIRMELLDYQCTLYILVSKVFSLTVHAKHIKITVCFPQKFSPTFLGLWYYLKALVFVQIAVLC